MLAVLRDETELVFDSKRVKDFFFAMDAWGKTGMLMRCMLFPVWGHSFLPA